jgi:transmembrane sensor
VQAGPVTVTAIGTKFTVRRDGEAVSVMVAEGVVEVSADPSVRALPTGETRTRALVLRARAGERVRFDRGELAQTVENLRTDIATSWRFGRLEFVDEPLRLVVAGVSRYSSREIIIDDPAIAELRFTGTVFENQIPAWLKGVESVFDVKVVELDAHRILITRNAPNRGATR